ncbi:MAG: glycosyltransferase family 4 protein [Pyrinomonadaceae bacterium]
MKKPSLTFCVVGNLIGRNTGFVTTQGLLLAELLAEGGFDVIAVSSKLNRLRRLFEICWTIVRSWRRIDVLIVEVYSGLGFFLADATSLLARILGIPSVLVLHGGSFPEFTESHAGWVKRVLGRAEALVAPSSFLADRMLRYGFGMRVIPNVIDLDSYAYRLRQKISPKLFWMRSFHPIYNPQMALDAFAAVKRELPEATLVMAGVDKGLEDAIKSSAIRMGLHDAVRFPGFLDEDAKIREFSGADIYMNTNRIDNMPVSVVEACAMGLPVVATDVGGLSRLIDHGENGLLVGDDDPNEMADAIMTLLRDPDLTERLSRNGRSLAEKSAWTVVRRAWEVLFDEILTPETGSDRRQSSASLMEP